MKEGFEEPLDRKTDESRTENPPVAKLPVNESRADESRTGKSRADESRTGKSRTGKSRSGKPQDGKPAQEADAADRAIAAETPKKNGAEGFSRRAKEIGSFIHKWTRPETVSGLALTLFAITAVVALVLSAGHYFTADVIAQRETAARNEAMRKVIQADSFETTADEDVFLARQDGQTIGYAVTAAPSGYGGPIQMIVGVGLDYKIIGVTLVSMTETPGYGSRAESEPWYFGQFTGKSLPLNYGEGALDALSGATVTSDAILDGVRGAVKRVIDYATGGGA